MPLLIAACGGGSGSGGSSGGSGGSAPPSPPPSTAADYSALQARLKSFVDNGTVSGVAFVLENGSGPLFSYADGDLTTDTVIRVASVSKAPGVAAILTLVDQGKLDLDQPVSGYLSPSINWPADKAAITARMLLNHTSGLPHLFAAGQPACLDIAVGISMQQCVQQIANAKLEYPPGTEFGYGGSDYQVAGYMATLLSGASSWEAFFDQRITQPLGITTFSYSATAGVTPSNPNVAGGGNVSANDYARFVRAVLDSGQSPSGQQVLSAAFVRQYGQSQIAGRPIDYSPVGSTLPGYSYGWFISDPSLHPGSAGPEISDQGLYGSTPWIDFDVGYGAVLFLQSDLTTGTMIWNSIRPLVLQTFGRAPG